MGRQTPLRALKTASDCLENDKRHTRTTLSDARVSCVRRKHQKPSWPARVTIYLICIASAPCSTGKILITQTPKSCDFMLGVAAVHRVPMDFHVMLHDLHVSCDIIPVLKTEFTLRPLSEFMELSFIPTINNSRINALTVIKLTVRTCRARVTIYTYTISCDARAKLCRHSRSRRTMNGYVMHTQCCRSITLQRATNIDAIEKRVR